MLQASHCTQQLRLRCAAAGTVTRPDVLASSLSAGSCCRIAHSFTWHAFGRAPRQVAVKFGTVKALFALLLKQAVHLVGS